MDIVVSKEKTKILSWFRIPSWLYTPNLFPAKWVIVTIAICQLLLALLAWSEFHSPLTQGPEEVLAAFPKLFEEGLGFHLMVSTWLFAESLGWAIIISLSIAYLSRLAFFFPAAALSTKLRFIGLTGLVFLLIMEVNDGHTLKVALLTFGITVFLTVGMMSVMWNSDMSNEMDYARTLGMNEWHILWEIAILGTLDQALDLIRQNAAIGWVMLTLVEGYYRSEGGIGVMLLNEDKTFNVASVFAIQGAVMCYGATLDLLLSGFRYICCPHIARTIRGG